MTTKRPQALIVFAAALAARLVHLLFLQRAPFFDLLMGDAAGYDRWAKRIAAGDWLGQGVFYQAPLYPYFLGLIYTLSGHGLLVVRAVQLVLGAAACGLMTVAAAKWFGRRAGIAAGLVLAFYAPALFFDGLIQKTILDGVFLCALLWVCASIAERPTIRLAFAAGVVLGALALTRENALVFAPIVFAWVWLRARRPAAAGAVALGLFVMLFPVALRNHVAGGGWQLTTAQSGPNFYIGNSPAATGMYVPLRPGRSNVVFEQQDARELAEEASGRSLTQAEISRYWRDRAIAWIAVAPRAWLQLLGKKALLEWNGVEAVDTDDMYTYRGWSPILNAASRILFFGVLAPIAVLGIWTTRGRWRDLWLIYALIAAYAAAVILFYVLARYRYPLAILIVPFAGAAIAGARGWWSGAAPRDRIAGVALTVAAAVVCNLPLLSIDGMRSGMHYNVGYTFQSTGRTQEAIDEYRAALALRPDNVDAHNALGVALAATGARDEALAEYRIALRLNPRSVNALTNLGIELANRGQSAEALALIQRAIDIDPKNPNAHYDLGVALVASDQLEPAMNEFRRAIQLNPDYADAYNNLGGVLAMQGRLAEAIEQFRAALTARPDFPAAKANLDRAIAEIKRD